MVWHRSCNLIGKFRMYDVRFKIYKFVWMIEFPRNEVFYHANKLNSSDIIE